MKKLLPIFLMCAACLGSCSKQEAPGKPNTGASAGPGGASAPAFKVGLVTDVGGVNDQSFNQSAWMGLQRFRDSVGAQASYIEAKDESTYAPNIDTFVDGKNNLIWGVGFMLGDALQQAGKDYPNQQFAIIDYAYSPEQVPNKNVTGVLFAAEECSFLVGYIAGKITKTGKVGHINGVASPNMENFAVGYYAGVLVANPEVHIMGQYAGSFADPAAGKAIANQYYADGADIIYAAAGATGFGAIEAAKEQNKWVIGVDMDQNYIAPNNVLTSALKRVDIAIYDVSDMARQGNLQGGSTLFYDLKNNGVGYATTGNHIPQEIIEQVEAIKAKIISGEQKVPATAAEINAMFPGKYDMASVEN
ncbi:MAG: BMP family ABC transporter substrate-binding protein [Spirochaetaceae bacterium]|jgi:basic membrane protein A|nr:BMP family ABC transporter substrate-binding protein [Spirochaetaceae bacterium]